MLRRHQFSSSVVVGGGASSVASPLAFSARLATAVRHSAQSGPQNKRIQGLWHRCYPTITEERWRDMYHCYYPYLFDHGDKMSLYPKIPENPREWQPEQLFATYDAVREDKYDAFIRLRTKYPELYQDTLTWETPPPFGEFNQFYSVRFGMIGVKAFTQAEFDELGNRVLLTALWFPDNQIVAHKTKDKNDVDRVFVGAMNVPLEFHKPYVTSWYKARRVPVKQVQCSFPVTPDAFAPVGTKLDVRHFRAGQEVDISYHMTDYGFKGVMFRHGHDGGPVWLGDSKWQKRPGSIGTEGAKRVWPGTRMGGQLGARALIKTSIPIYRIDWKNSLVYIAAQLDADIGCYVQIKDSLNMYGKTTWNSHQGLPAFPTFVPHLDEDLSALPSHECQTVSLPLYHRLQDEGDASALITQADVDDARAVKPAAPPAKKKSYDMYKWNELRKKLRKGRNDRRKKYMIKEREKMKVKQDEVRQEKLKRKRRVL